MAKQDDYSRVVKTIAACEDIDKLNNFLENAIRKNVPEVRDAAVQKLASLMPNFEPGTLEHDFWKTIKTYELVLREDEKTTVHLFRTRKKAAVEGIEKTMSDWVLHKAHGWVFDALIEIGKPEMTAESVVLRYPERFDEAVIDVAMERLDSAIPLAEG